MKVFTSRSLSLVALVCAVATLALPGAALAKTEIHFWHAMTGRAGRGAGDPGQAVQREPGRVRDQAAPQGQLLGDADRGHRGLPPEEPTAHRAGLRGRHPDDDAVGRGLSGLGADARQRGQDRLERLHQAGGRLLHQGRQALLDAVQLVDADLLLQQGRLQEGRTRPREAAEDLAGRGSVRQEDHRGRRRQVRVLHRMAVVDDGREHARDARPALRHQAQRLRRRRGCGAADQRRVRPQAHRRAERLAEGQRLFLRRPRRHRRSQVRQRRLRDVHPVLGAHLRLHASRSSSTGAPASCRTGARPTRRRRRSSAAPPCGCSRASRRPSTRAWRRFLDYPRQARAADVVARQHRLPGHLQHGRAATSSRATTS